MDASFADIDAVFLDLDGTLYLGDALIPGSLEFLSRCKERGVRRFFLSNNSSRSVEQYLAKLHGLGIPAEVDDIMLSTHDLLAWLANEGVSRTWLVGTEGMRSMLESKGVSTQSEDPEYVVVGYDTEIDYAKIATATIHLHRGVPLVASHPDMVCPSPDGGLPDVGAYLAMFEASTGVTPTHVCGKPNPSMIGWRIEALGLSPERCAMVGDRLYTDIVMASRAEINGVLVLSGEARMADVEVLADGVEEIPDLVVNSVDDLLR